MEDFRLIIELLTAVVGLIHAGLMFVEHLKKPRKRKNRIPKTR